MLKRRWWSYILIVIGAALLFILALYLGTILDMLIKLAFPPPKEIP